MKTLINFYNRYKTISGSPQDVTLKLNVCVIKDNTNKINS